MHSRDRDARSARSCPLQQTLIISVITRRYPARTSPCEQHRLLLSSRGRGRTSHRTCPQSAAARGAARRLAQPPEVAPVHAAAPATGAKASRAAVPVGAIGGVHACLRAHADALADAHPHSNAHAEAPRTNTRTVCAAGPALRQRRTSFRSHVSVRASACLLEDSACERWCLLLRARARGGAMCRRGAASCSLKGAGARNGCSRGLRVALQGHAPLPRPPHGACKRAAGTRYTSLLLRRLYPPTSGRPDLMPSFLG